MCNLIIHTRMLYDNDASKKITNTMFGFYLLVVITLAVNEQVYPVECIVPEVVSFRSNI